MEHLTEEQCKNLIQKGLKIKELKNLTKRSETYLRSLASKNNLTISRSKKEPAKNATEKECITCKLILPTSSFYKQTKKDKDLKWDYYDSSCKNCRLEYSLERRRAIKRQALDYKGWSCNSCGLIDKDYPQIYDFHHIDPSQKDFAISKNTLVFEKIKNELDKCIVLCANCHRKVHAEDV